MGWSFVMTALPCSYRFDHAVCVTSEGGQTWGLIPRKAGLARRCWAESEVVALRAGMLKAGCSVRRVSGCPLLTDTLERTMDSKSPALRPNPTTAMERAARRTCESEADCGQSDGIR